MVGRHLLGLCFLFPVLDMKSLVSCIFGRDIIVTWRSKNGKLPTTGSSMKSLRPPANGTRKSSRHSLAI